MTKIGDLVKRLFSNNSTNSPPANESHVRKGPRDYWIGSPNANQSRRTVNDLPKLGSTSGHWFDGQSEYTVDRRPNMSSDSSARLEAFLTTRTYDELKLLDTTRTDKTPQSSRSGIEENISNCD